MATPSPSKRKGDTALNGSYWQPLEEKKRRRTAPPVFTVEDPFYSKIEKNLLKSVLDESKQVSTPKKSRNKAPKEKEVETPKKSDKTSSKKKRNSKTEETKKSPKPKEEEKTEVVVIPDSPTRIRKSGNRSYIRRSVSSSPSKKNAKSLETSSSIEPVDGTESEVSKKEDTDSEIDIISLDDDEPPKPPVQQPIEKVEKETKTEDKKVDDDDEEETSKPQRKRKKKDESESKQSNKKKLKETTTTTTTKKTNSKEKLKRTSSSKTRTLKGESGKKKHEKSLRLDEALSRTDMEGWSSARINAYKAIETNPNMYYYRFNAPGEKQRNGGWTDEEKELFHTRMEELGGTGDYQWGIFSMAIPGRVGYQCANFYRKLIKEGSIKDENYSLNDKGEPVYIGGKSKKKSKSKEEEVQEISPDSEKSPKKSKKSKKQKKENKENVAASAVDNSSPKKSKKKTSSSSSPKSSKNENNEKSESPISKNKLKSEEESPKSRKSSSPKKLKQMKLDAMIISDKTGETTPEKPKRGRPRKGQEKSKKKKGKMSEEEKLLRSEEKKKLELAKRQQEKEIKAQRKLDLERELEERLKGKEIIPRVFLGNKDVARNQEWLQENQVKHVVNVTREVGNYYEDELNYKRIVIDDSMDQDIAKHFEDTCEFISKALKESEGNILVHCNEGRSRSVTLIIAYLMKYENMDLSSAYHHIHSKSTTKINDGFKRQLMSYELSLGKEKSMEFFPSRRNSKENVLSNSGSRVSTPVTVKEISVVAENSTTTEEVSEMKSLFSKVLSSSTSVETTTNSLNLQLPASDDLSFMALDEIPGTSPPAPNPNQLIKLDPSLDKSLIPPPTSAIDRTDSISDMEEEPLSDPMYWGAEIYSDHETTTAVPPNPQNPKPEELFSVGLDDEWLNGILTQ